VTRRLVRNGTTGRNPVGNELIFTDSDIRIVLSSGAVAVIDADMAHLTERRWYEKRCLHGNCYAMSNGAYVNGVREPPLWLHHAIIGKPEGRAVVDHIDGDGLNCTRVNLRVVSNMENTRNRGANAQKNNSSSQFLGVRRRKDRYTAHIKIHGSVLWLGSYPTEDEANVARLKKEQELWGITPRRADAFRRAGWAL
jgi:hypothetical protein